MRQTGRAHTQTRAIRQGRDAGSRTGHWPRWVLMSWADLGSFSHPPSSPPPPTSHPPTLHSLPSVFPSTSHLSPPTLRLQPSTSHPPPTTSPSHPPSATLHPLLPPPSTFNLPSYPPPSPSIILAPLQPPPCQASEAPALPPWTHREFSRASPERGPRGTQAGSCKGTHRVPSPRSPVLGGFRKAWPLTPRVLEWCLSLMLGTSVNHQGWQGWSCGQCVPVLLHSS